jgi:polygalacturonase
VGTARARERHASERAKNECTSSMTHGAGSLSVASGPGMMAMLLRLALCVGTGRVASETNPPVSAASSWPLQHGAATGRPLRLAAAQGMVADSATGQLIDVRTLGAKADNRTDCTAAIVKALELARAAPGSVVLLPAPGIYLSGPLLLNGTEHLTLRIEAGATLASLGIQLARQSRWPIVPGMYPASEPALRRGRIYAPILWLKNAHNVVVEGGGMISGRGEDGWWQSAVRPPITPNATCPDPQCPGCEGSCPKRPRLFLCQNSSFVTVQDLTFHHSPFWTAHFYNSTDIKVSRLTVDNPSGGPHGHAPFVSTYGYGPNADGIDVEHSRRVLIEDSHVRCGDDAICLKSGAKRHFLRHLYI